MENAVLVRQYLHEARVQPTRDGDRSLAPRVIEQMVEHAIDGMRGGDDLYHLGNASLVRPVEVPSNDVTLIPDDNLLHAAAALRGSQLEQPSKCAIVVLHVK